MARAAHPTAGLGTTIALRTFLLFCACAVLPVMVFGVVGYRYIDRLVHEQSMALMQDHSKRFGLLLHERLAQADALLYDMAVAELANPRTTGRVMQASMGRVQVLPAQPDNAPRGVPAAAATAAALDRPLPAGFELWRSLEIPSPAAAGQVVLRSILRSPDRAVEIVASLAPSYLWNSETVELPGGRVCVQVERQQLYCSGDPLQTSRSQSARWELFLKARYGASSWWVIVEQDSEVAMAGARAFRATLPLIAGVSIAIAVLLSAIQIRRSNRPLRLLTDAAMRMSKGRHQEMVRIPGRDEYANLGRAFNLMAGNVRRQIQALSTMSGIDQQILALPEADPIIASLVPRMPQILDCDAVAVLLGTGAGQVMFYAGERAGDACARRPLPFDLQRLASLVAQPGVKFDARDLAWLDSAADLPACQSWRAAPVYVDESLRAVVLAGFARRRVRWRGARQLAGIAHRIAVVIGNEDREALLVRQAYYDGLTSLPNRQLFKDRLDRELALARHNAAAVALLFIDLDHFKNVNDSLGHTAGDQVLQLAARRLAAVMPPAATLARLGGDEFTVLLPLAHTSSPAEIARQIHDVLDAPFRVADAEFSVQGSVGIAVFPQDGASAEELLRNADIAMYRAKSAGRGRAAFFEESMNIAAKRRSRLASKLRTALDAGVLQLVYQPKIEAKTGRFAGVEALARWRDVEDGVISPGEFIPLAEETGLINRLGIWAVEEACRTLLALRRAGTDVPHVAVNLSMHQLRDHSFVDNLAGILRETGLPPQMLHLEITESGLAPDMRSALELMHRLRAMGVQLAIDDFGTGYSSMSSLARLPIEVLKIDKSFVDGCASSPSAAALIRGMLAMGHALGKEIVAEGVETQAQADFLRAEGCEYLQGYLFGAGMDADALAAFVAQHCATPGAII